MKKTALYKKVIYTRSKGVRKYAIFFDDTLVMSFYHKQFSVFFFSCTNLSHQIRLGFVYTAILGICYIVAFLSDHQLSQNTVKISINDSINDLK